MVEITTDNVRLGYAVSKDNRDPYSLEARYNPTVHVTAWEVIRDRAYVEFDTWLAEHDRQVAEGAWTEGVRATATDDFEAAWAERCVIPHNPYREDR